MTRRRDAGVRMAQTEANVIRNVEALRRVKRAPREGRPIRHGWKAAGALIGASLFAGLLLAVATLLPR